MSDNAGAAAMPSEVDAEVRTEKRGAAMWITIQREQRRNALNPEVMRRIQAGIEAAAETPGLRAVVLTGAGEKAFCAGADLSQGTDVFSPEGLDEPGTDFGRLARRVRELGLPLIARINGACVAGGMGLMSLCDLAVAAEHARFGLPEVRVGVFPMQVLVPLRRLIGPRLVNELCLTGELISAQRACEIGLLNAVVPGGKLDAAVHGLIAKLALASPTAIKRGKAAIAAMEQMTFHEALPFAEAQIAIASRTGDAREGLAAFNEKRLPHWAAPAEDTP
jgi:enoyl-CoA hydratase/carnithine racemase